MNKGDDFRRWTSEIPNSLILSEENRHTLPVSCPELWFHGNFKCSLSPNIFEKKFINADCLSSNILCKILRIWNSLYVLGLLNIIIWEKTSVLFFFLIIKSVPALSDSMSNAIMSKAIYKKRFSGIFHVSILT